MAEVVTAKMNEKGRIIIPKAAREALGVEGRKAIVRVEIEVRGEETAENGEEETHK